MTAPDMPLDRDRRNAFVATALAEDIGAGDLTTSRVVSEDRTARACIVAREPMTLAASQLAEAVFAALDPRIAFGARAQDGAGLAAGDRIAVLEGPARPVLTGERTALNILQHFSGIATLTRAYVEAVAGTNARILDTRKTTPLLRRLEKYAVACGGGQNHRTGLYDAVMIKDNHIAVAGSIAAAIKAAKATGPEPVQVECDSLDQVEQALAAGADSLLLDNMDTETLRLAVRISRGRAPLEASGGVTLETVRAIAETGVDFVSVGRLTQSAPAVDIGLDFEEL